MLLDLTLLGGVVAAVLSWAVLSAYILRVQHRRYGTRAALSSTFKALEPLAGAPVAERLARVLPLLRGASRELVMSGAADRDVPTYVFDTLVALLAERWTLDSLVRDAAHHRSARDKWRRVTALRILGRLEHPGLVSLLGAALDDTDDDVSSCSLALLSRSRDPRAVDVLLGALASPHLSASRVAVYVDQSPQDLGPALAALLSHVNPVVRQWAATLVARYPDEPVAGRLAELTRDADPRVRKAAIQALGRVGGDAAIEPAEALLTDPVSFVRAYAVRTLGDRGHVDQAHRVAALLADGDWWVRLATREALEQMGAEVWPVLVRCLDHRDRFVRNGAAEVMQNLGVLDNLIMMEAATDSPAPAKVDMLQRIAAAGGPRFAESLVERAGPVVGPRVRRLLDTMGLEHVDAC